MKLRKISDITATLSFTEFDFMQKYRESFAVSELGRIYAQLPLKELAEKIRSHFLVQLKNALFHAPRTENLPANSKPYRHTTITSLSPAKNSSH